MSALERILEVTWVKSDFILEKKKKKKARSRVKGGCAEASSAILKK